jgi:LuxR family transcriptional regulator, maltose regulon positive regulatory protein
MDLVGSRTRLFEAKYRVPTAARVLSRPRLYTQLDDARDCKVVVVSAPAGFGKTTLVASWLLARRCNDSECADAQCGGFQAAWLSLDERENNFAAFAANLAGALQSCCRCLSLDVADLLQLPAVPPVSTVAHTLIEDLARLPHPITLTLDDYHVIREPAIHELLRLLVDYSPDHFRLILIARHDPPLPIARLVLQGKARQIRMNELRFDSEEAYSFLDLVLGEAVPREARAAAVEQAGGWIAHLGLAAILLRQSLELAPLESARNLAVSYLIDDLLATAPSEVRTFLLATSVLERFCAPLASALLAQSRGPSRLLAPANGRQPGEVFRQVVEEGLFLAQLDATRTWHRYHDLFRELLLQSLRSEYPGEELRLRRRAFEWLKSQGYVEEALAQAQALQDEQGVADLVEAHVLQALERYEWQTVGRWLDLLAPEIVRRRPTLLLAQAYLLANAGAVDRLGRVLVWAEEALSELPDSYDPLEYRLLAGTWELLRSEYALCANDIELSLSSAQQALETLPPGHWIARGFAAIRVQSGLAHQGKLQEAQATLREQLAEFPDRTSPIAVRVQLSLGLNYARAADLKRAKREFDFIEQVLATPQPYNECWLHYALGRIAYEWNHLDAAAERFRMAARSHGGNYVRAFDSLRSLALVHQSAGRPEEADRALEQASELARGVRSEDLVQLALSMQTRILLMRGVPDTNTTSYSPSAREDRLVLYMPIEIPRLTEARRLMMLGQRANLLEAQRILEDAVDYFVKTHTLLLLVPALALLALLYRMRDQKSRALSTLSRAVELGATGGFIRSFLDLGPDLVGLLYELKMSGPAGDHVAEILAMAAKERRDHSPAHARDSVVEALTNRELAVLQLLAEGLTDKEIASSLVISPLTVRKHAGNIFDKLQVRNRRQAAVRARELGLVRSELLASF